MRVRTTDGDRVGQALDLRDEAVEPTRLVESIRDPESPVVSAARPGAVHERVGLLHPDMDLDIRGALAVAGRSIGLEAPQATAIASLNRRIEAIDPDAPDLRAARRRAATAGEEVVSLKERVERTSGRLTERRAADQPTEELEAKLADLTQRLTEAETEAIAARQALSQAQAAAATARDERERRLALVDRRENRRREARAWFLEALSERFEQALAALPIEATPAPPSSYDGPPFAAALAIARLGAIDAPLVVADGPFETPIEARGALDAPVILTRL